MTPGEPGAGSRVSLASVQQVSTVEAADIASLVAAADAEDGVDPLDDQVLTELTFGAGPDSHHVLGRLAGRAVVVGYGHVAADARGLSGHLVVHPDHRRRGVGSAFVDHLVALLGTGPADRRSLRLWAHGDTDGARALAAARGFHRSRDLCQMRRDLAVSLPAPSYPDDVTVRPFEPGRDEEAWVALNAAAFAAHPEQGRLTPADLRHRIEQPWFDPAGFFLAERDGALVGSHWTKVHPAEGPASGPVGEVYAIGVHPRAQGLGLGKALTLTGLQHLRDRGLAEVMLYVDGDNTAGIGLYGRLGFTTTRVDVMYEIP